ncbi:acid-sensing ion channel 5-like [Lingula anatina]|uniref:Acid-sensing ion channel 5-like n=1 Tax=Lingula anatina TaxID=7574 RepID=A0A1S3HE31_LINAN|nr:acid-sensing ion channel 5-like [Lingula anatina]|eukprot:XP_013384332.1 acid-sensing ion channel 5-like [Lingula anatina]
MISPSPYLRKTDNSSVQAQPAIEQFADRVNCQALQEIVSKESGFLRRIIWLAFFLGGLILMGFQIYERSIFYSSRPVRVNTYTVIPRSVKFPAVTLCNYNAISKFTARNMGQLEAFERYFPLSLGDQNFDGLNNSRFEWDSVLNNTETFLQKCIWRGTKCSMDNFSRIYTDMGVCYSFNHEVRDKKRLESDSSGSLFGLQLTLDVQQADYFRGFAGKGAGFKVMVHDPREPPLITDMGFSVGAGMHTLVGLKMINISNLDTSQWGKCNRDIKLKHHVVYSQSACRLECLYEYMEKKCQCVRFLKFKNHQGPRARLCDPEQLFNCYTPNYNLFIQEKGQCSHTCPVACESIKYEVSLSQAPVADYHAYNSATTTNETKVNKYRKNFVQLDIFFREISYERREQYQAYNAFTLGCDIGGALGLILGASVLTLFEVGDFIILMVLKGKWRRQTQVTSVSVHKK